MEIYLNINIILTLSVLVINCKQFKSELPIRLLLLYPLLDETHFRALPPDLWIRNSYLIDFANVSPYDSFFDACDVFEAGVVLLGLRKEPVALKRKQNMAGLTGSH